MEIIRKNDQSSFISQDKAHVREIASPRNSGIKNHSLAEVTIKPGNSVVEHYHVKSEELFYVLQGNGVMTVEGERCPVGIGDTVVVQPRTVHTVKNVGKRDLIMLVICSPSYRDEDQVFPENM